MWIVTIVLGLLCVLFAALYCLQRTQTVRLAKQLEKRNREGRARIVTMTYPSAANRALVREINRFLSEKQRTEQAFRAEELRLQEAISNISHDMRTPLTAILGYVRLTRSEQTPQAEKAKYLAIIEARARSLQRLILDFYDLSRFGEDSYAPEIEPVDVNACCRELLAELYDSLAQKGSDVVVDLAETAPAVPADRAAVRRVCENLLQNAASHGAGEIRVSSELAGDTLILSVSNPSPEIRPEQLARLFERSYTTSPSRTEGNTGLGLTICKTLIERMGHEIGASYRDGIFTVQIQFHLSKSKENIAYETRKRARNRGADPGTSAHGPHGFL